LTNKYPQTDRVLSYLDKHYPHAGCELTYQKDYELLIAVVLSAQTTDEAVNKVTPPLFKAYPSLSALAGCQVEDLYPFVRSIGLFKAKAKHIIEIAQRLMMDYDSKVPSDKAALLTLPGVGVKTANVVRAELFALPEIAVDTHVYRLAYRLGYRKFNDDVHKTETKLKKAIPIQRHILFHHQLIHFGRYFCTARKPQCYHCELVDLCKEKNKNLKK